MPSNKRSGKKARKTSSKKADPSEEVDNLRKTIDAFLEHNTQPSKSRRIPPPPGLEPLFEETDREHLHEEVDALLAAAGTR